MGIQSNKRIAISRQQPENGLRPSISYLFRSVADVFGANAIGVLLTGMGKDGVNGLQAIKSEGGKTIAESEETSILYGMPKSAAETGAADKIIPNYNIVKEMIRFTN